MIQGPLPVESRVSPPGPRKTKRARPTLPPPASRNQQTKSQAPALHCTRKSPLPLLPSGPGGVGGKTARRTDAWIHILSTVLRKQENPTPCPWSKLHPSKPARRPSHPPPSPTRLTT